MLSNSPIVHLAVDAEEFFCKQLLPARAKSFPRDIKGCADHLRDNAIPTIWITCPGTTGPIMRAGDASFALLAPLGKLGVQPDDFLFPKSDDSAFAGGMLAAVLGHKPTLLVTGTSTTVCVASTAVGAAVNGFNCVILTDRLADMFHPEEETNPDWHMTNVWNYAENLLAEMVERGVLSEDAAVAAKKRITYTTSGEYLPTLQPASALAQTPKAKPVEAVAG